MGHYPVMLPEVLTYMSAKDGDVLIDGTFGGGGYTRALLSAADCRVLAIDRDLDAISRAEQIALKEPRLVPLLGRFGDLDTLAKDAGIESVDGVVLDLGVSSFQLDEADRGFSFMRDGPLDMRMGRAGPSAADVVAQLPEKDLANLIYRLGEEKQSRRIASVICARRGRAPFTTTLDLAETIETALGGRKGARTHPATRTFQAIRMYVNDELGQLARALIAAENILSAGGRLVVVTFHSLEDRMVKLFLRTRAGLSGGGSRHMPERKAGAAPSFDMPSKKSIEPSLEEIADNPRSRSARLRYAIRTSAPAWTSPVSTGLDLPPLSALEVAA